MVPTHGLTAARSSSGDWNRGQEHDHAAFRPHDHGHGDAVRRNLELDLPRAQELALKLIDEGSDALVVCGTTGESPTVFYPQKLDLFSAVIEAVDGRVPIIANAGDNCTRTRLSSPRRSRSSAWMASWP